MIVGKRFYTFAAVFLALLCLTSAGGLPFATVFKGGPQFDRLVQQAQPAPGEVLVSVRSVGLNQFDIDLRENISRWPLPLQWIL